MSNTKPDDLPLPTFGMPEPMEGKDNEGDDDDKEEQKVIIYDPENEKLEDTFTTTESEGFSLDFIQKIRTGDQIRKNFLSKLTYQKIWLTPAEKPKQHESCIIFDWDDTLLCTSFINPSGVYEAVDLSVTI